MSLKRKPIDIPALDDGFAPPIDEARREALRNDPTVRYYCNPNPEERWSYTPTIRLAYPVEPSELTDGDDPEDLNIFCR